MTEIVKVTVFLILFRKGQCLVLSNKSLTNLTKQLITFETDLNSKFFYKKALTESIYKKYNFFGQSPSTWSAFQTKLHFFSFEATTVGYWGLSVREANALTGDVKRVLFSSNRLRMEMVRKSRGIGSRYDG